MPPKQKTSKKAEQNKKKQVLDDKTFGLKNKNKSKKVQGFVQQVKKQVEHSGSNQGKKAGPDRRALRKAKEAAKAELDALLGAGLENASKKSISAKKGATDAVAVETNKQKQEQVTIYIEDEPKTLEDMIEEQREKFRQEGTAGTPVTEESLRAWKERKAERRRAEAEAKLRAETLKKGGGKGLGAISGRDLFTLRAELFVDDEGALGDEANERDRSAQGGRGEGGDEEEKKEEEANLEEKKEEAPVDVGEIAVAVEEQLYLEGEDDDLDDIADSDEES